MSNQNFSKNTVSSLNEIIQVLNSNQINKLNNNFLQTAVPKNCLNEPCILGVDEAGRGPVLGPMVYSVFYCSANDHGILDEIGCTDSKALTEKKREEIFELINNKKEIVGWAVDVISPNLISNNMQKRVKYSLNEIAQKSTINLIENILEKKVNLKEIYVDTIGPPDKYQEKLAKLFPQCKVVVKKKADLLYPIVGAASICAKVIRDTVIQHWKYLELLSYVDVNVGTGYPGDPKTKKFLLEHRDDIFGFPTLVRFSWSTAAKLLESSAALEWEDDDTDKEKSSEKLKISSYFQPRSGEVKHKMNCSYFKERSLYREDTF